MQSALVAGGAGFIGSHLCKRLLDEYKVICIDNLITGDRKNIEPLLENSNFKFLKLDVSKPLEIGTVDFVFHLASPASPNNKNPKSYINYPIETLLANSLGTYNLLEFSKKGNSKFLFASSSEVYGDPNVSPQKEDYYGNVSSTGIRSVYDEGKRFGEAMTIAYFRKFDLDTKIVRIFNTYGPKMPDDGRVIVNFLFQAFKNKPLTVYGDGKQTRSFCYVDDLVEGLLKIMFSSHTKGEIINLGNPSEIQILEIANTIKKLTGSSSDLVFEELPEDDPKSRKPDISKAENLLGWKPKVNLQDGLKKTIEYFKN